MFSPRPGSAPPKPPPQFVAGPPVPTELTDEHLKLLYLVWMYTCPPHALTVTDATSSGSPSKPPAAPRLASETKERWLRGLPLLVLIYEGIVAKAFDYDYAPFSEVRARHVSSCLPVILKVLGHRRVYVNISQEGRDDIDDLREMGILDGLKVSTKGYQAVSAYHLSPKGPPLSPPTVLTFRTGLKVLQERVTAEHRAAVESFVFAPNSKNLLRYAFASSRPRLCAEHVPRSVSFDEKKEVFLLR
jgi:hypothetical protein